MRLSYSQFDRDSTFSLTDPFMTPLQETVGDREMNNPALPAAAWLDSFFVS